MSVYILNHLAESQALQRQQYDSVTSFVHFANLNNIKNFLLGPLTKPKWNRDLKERDLYKLSSTPVARQRHAKPVKIVVIHRNSNMITDTPRHPSPTAILGKLSKVSD